MKPDVLYPVGYDESALPAPAPVPGAGEGRDVGAARALIRRAVPPGGNPMAVDQLLDLVCGCASCEEDMARLRAGDLSGVVSVDADETAAILRAKEPARPGRVIKGPDACRSLRYDEVRALVREVIGERQPTWGVAEAEAMKP